MPYSTTKYEQFNLRIFPAMLKSLREASQQSGTPVNTLIQQALEESYASPEYWQQFEASERSRNAALERAQAKLDAKRDKIAADIQARRAAAERREALADRLLS